ncbi:MAG: rhomboid family intramembrane serine protease, partial [Crocinitomicaceae bacterium]|nr:rhomboid family intramembrane serine protease [Crocinitomicaceae bacterium]
MKDFYNIFLKYYWILFFLLFLWLVHFANIHFHLNLYKLGVFPRTLDGLWGIVFAPLV